jgi:hypothetical protein
MGRAAEKTIEQRIKSEKSRLLKVFVGIDENQLKVAKALIERAAFITVSLQDLEEELNRKGWTESYINGTQIGIKRSAAADVHISLTKNMTVILKQLLDITPAAQRKESRLQQLIRE